LPGIRRRQGCGATGHCRARVCFGMALPRPNVSYGLDFFRISETIDQTALPG
jgi:hypothetical protein